ncbi:MAG: endolytic transglycosylase MltG [Succinivibrio sp.]|nr:endolytic transglycosylase MltG [Succinivibrio sp.]
MRIGRILIFVAVLLSAALLIGGALYLTSEYERLNAYKIPQRPEAYSVPAGAGVRRIATDLLGDEFPAPLVHLWVFNADASLSAVQKGDYAIDGNKTLAQLLADMVAGNVAVKTYPTLLIVEGSNLAALKERLSKLEGGQKALDELAVPVTFMHKALTHGSDLSLLESLGGPHNSLEGLLMPATYPVFDNRAVSAAVGRALTDMAQFMYQQWPLREEDLPLKTPYEALIIASIIERETLVDDERPKVAAVFYNRLAKKMRLQTDPTVMYGISPDFKGRLTKAMLGADTPYNTYTRDGLPPTPISMPSRSSIVAALHPAEVDSLYFVAKSVDPREGHVFSATLGEHNKAVKDYRKKVKDYQAARQAQAEAQNKEQAKAQPQPTKSGSAKQK